MSFEFSTIGEFNIWGVHLYDLLAFQGLIELDLNLL